MIKRGSHVLAIIIAATTGGWLVVGCSAHVSVGGSSTVPRQSVENEVATTLARQLNQPVPKVVCPGNLQEKVGAVMYCSLTAQGSSTTYPVKVQVASISGNQVHFHIDVSQTPGQFTAPA